MKVLPREELKSLLAKYGTSLDDFTLPDTLTTEDMALLQRYFGDERWEDEYKSYRYGLPHFDIPSSDPRMREAKKLFEGYMDTKENLKNRYRTLVKQYHPDNGGDTQLFQCICEVFDKIMESLL